MRPSRRVREFVADRDDGLCVWCGQAAWEIHHRLPARMGGSNLPWVHEPPNLVSLCRTCHRGVESNRLIGILTGYLIPSGTMPADVPIKTWRGWALLTDSGMEVVEGDLQITAGGLHIHTDSESLDS